MRKRIFATIMIMAIFFACGCRGYESFNIEREKSVKNAERIESSSYTSTKDVNVLDFFDFNLEVSGSDFSEWNNQNQKKNDTNEKAYKNTVNTTNITVMHPVRPIETETITTTITVNTTTTAVTSTTTRMTTKSETEWVTSHEDKMAMSTITATTTTKIAVTDDGENKKILSKDKYLKRVILPQYTENPSRALQSYSHYWVAPNGKIILKKGRTVWDDSFIEEDLPAIIPYADYTKYCLEYGLPNEIEFSKIFIYQDYVDFLE